MLNETVKSCNKKPVIHKINIFHLHTAYRFFTTSCLNCKLQSQCKNINHKREICMVASYAEKLLNSLTQGRVSSFRTDDFYILPQNKYKKQKLERVLKSIQKKYISSQYVKE